jgi:DNA-binding response OmpR family regulator
VMIVGSDAHFVYLMRYYSERSGHQVVVAPIDEKIMALVGQKRPVMIVLEPDLMVPASRDLLRALKADQATCDIPVVVCSWQDKATSILAQEADSYLRKPVSYEEFLVALKEATHNATDHRG